jgi:hypothetical protein
MLRLGYCFVVAPTEGRLRHFVLIIPQNPMRISNKSVVLYFKTTTVHGTVLLFWIFWILARRFLAKYDIAKP